MSLIGAILTSPLRYGLLGLMLAYIAVIWSGTAVGIIVLVRMLLTGNSN